MKIEFELTKEDYIAFNMHHVATSPTIKRSLLLQQYGVSIVFLIVPYFFSKVTGAPMLLSFVVYGAIFVAWILYYPKYFMAVTQKRVKRLIEEGDNSAIYGPHSMELTEDGVLQVGHSGESKSSWSSVKRIDETPEHIYIFIGSVNAYVVPVRAFDSKTQKDVFLEIIREKTSLSK